MIYDHIVKINDEYYPAGTEVPEERKKIEEEEISFSDENIEFETEPVKRGRPKKAEANKYGRTASRIN